MAIILKGAPAAEAIYNSTDMPKGACLAIVRVGEKPSDIAYENSIRRAMAKAGAEIKSVVLPESCTQSEAEAALEALNNDKNVHGILPFCPMPDRIDEKKLLEKLSPEKDMDGLTVSSAGALMLGSGRAYPPCTAQACIELMDYYGIELEGKNVVVIGRSPVVGKPLAMLLLKRDATVTLCHSRTENLPSVCRRADILIAAIGRAELIGAEYLSAGQIIIDVGINSVDGRICGDVVFEEAECLAGAISPVPGGVGSVTSAVLAKHLAQAAAGKS